MMQMEREIRKILDPEWGNYSIEKTNGGHIRITLRAGEHEKTVFTSSTPSDYRTIPNTKAELRRAMRELSYEAGIRRDQPDALDKLPKRKHRETHKPRPVFHIASQLHQPAPEPERRTFQLPDPSVPEVTGRRLNLMSAAEPTPKERVQRKVKRGTPEFAEMMREKMIASWARRKAEGKVKPKTPKVPKAPKVAAAEPANALELLGLILAELRTMNTRLAAMEAQPAPSIREQMEAILADAAERGQPLLVSNRALPGRRRPDPKRLRRLLVRDRRWQGWREKHGLSSHTMSNPTIRALAQEWGFTDETGHWTEHGSACDALVAAQSSPVAAETPEPEPEPDPDPTPAPAPAQEAAEPAPAPEPASAPAGQRTKNAWGSPEWRAQLAANAAKARAAKVKKEAARAREAKRAAKAEASRVNGTPRPLMATPTPTKPPVPSKRKVAEPVSRSEERKLRRRAR